MAQKNTTKEKSPAKKKPEVYYQQGDVLLFRVDSIPNDVTVREDNAVAYGEVTGHSHKMKGKAKVLVTKKTKKKPAETYVQVDKASNIEHEEHKPIKIPKGKYKTKIVRERNHFLDVTQQVVD